MSVKEGGAFETFRDPNGNVLSSINRDGSILAKAIDFGDGTVQTTAAGGGAGGFPVTGTSAKLTQTVANQVSADALASPAGTGDAFVKATVFVGPGGLGVSGSLSFSGDDLFLTNAAGDVNVSVGAGVGPGGTDGINLQTDTGGQTMSLTAGGSANGVVMGADAVLKPVGTGSIEASILAPPLAPNKYVWHGYFADSIILALNTAAVTLFTAPVNLLVIPIAASFTYIYGGVSPITGTHTNDLAIFSNLATVSSPYFIGSSTGLISVNSTNVCQIPAQHTSPVSFTLTSDSIALKNTGAAYTGGDVGDSNQLGVAFSYYLFDPATQLFV